MTFRAKPVVKRAHRPSWETDSRRNLILNLGFGLVVLLALLLLGGAVGLNYYNAHWIAVAHVNGVAISKDDESQRIAVDTWRLNYAEDQIRTEVNQGIIASADGSQRIQTIESEKQQIPSVALGELIDATLQGQLAAQQGISVTDKQVADALTAAATTPEMRHAWVIAISPSLTVGASKPTDAQVSAAQARAEQLLTLLKGGLKWEDVAKANSSDTTAEQGGDLGYLMASDTTQDAAFLKALFALPGPGLTPVVKGADGVFRIGRVSQIVPKTVDSLYQQKMSAAGVSLDTYQKVLRANLVYTALSDKVTADLTTKASVQRHVLEIMLTGPQQGEGAGDEVDSRHILFSPNHDPSGAASGKYPATDPAWANAKAAAEAAYQQLIKGKADFQTLAKTESDDTSSGANGGDIGWVTENMLTTNYAKAIFAPNLKPGQILPPVQTEYGWHVIQFLGRRAPAESRINVYAAEIKDGKDFGTLAKSVSESSDASSGGDMGWVAHYQLDETLENAIFSTPVGGVSPIVNDPSNGNYYLFKVVSQETRKPAGAQLTTLQSSAYTNWYAIQKAKANIQQSDAAAAAAAAS